MRAPHVLSFGQSMEDSRAEVLTADCWQAGPAHGALGTSIAAASVSLL